MLDGIFASLYTTSVTAPAFLAVCLLSVGLGYGIALTYRKISSEGGTMFSALTVLPFLVQLVILLVNGNLGAGVAVAGRSVWCGFARHPAPRGISRSFSFR